MCPVLLLLQLQLLLPPFYSVQKTGEGVVWSLFGHHQREDLIGLQGSMGLIVVAVLGFVMVAVVLAVVAVAMQGE
jgi:hypothetical protein